MSKPPNHEFKHPTVQEIGYIPPHAFGQPEHDTFIDGLTLNDLEDYHTPIDEYAKNLAKTALRDVSKPSNVVNIDDYRHGPQAA